MQFARGVGGSGSAAAVEAVFNELGLFVVTASPYNATGDGVTDDGAAIQAAVDACAAAGGVVLFPGGAETLYRIESGLVLPNPRNVKLSAPGGARILIGSAVGVAIAVGNIDTGINLAQGNTLASNAAAGAMSLALSAGKGSNFVAGAWCVLKSNAVVPEHDAAVVNKRAEFVKIQDVSGDTIDLDRPLRYTYNTADSAELCNVTWIENFAIDGLGFDGNDHTECPVALQLSWCMAPKIVNVHGEDLPERLIRLQGCMGARLRNISQENGLSDGFLGDSSHESYMISEGGLNEDLIATALRADAVRHGYTTIAGWTTNAGVTSAISGIGVPTRFRVGPGHHANARGAAWDTHEVGVDGVFDGLTASGSRTVGFQVRSVRTRLINGCGARDGIGAALQIGSDAQDTVVDPTFWEHNNNLGTDEATSTDWTKKGPIVDNSPRAYLGTPVPNEVDNGNFDLWERGTSFTATGGTANRWRLTLGTGAAVTASRQSHTVGSGTIDGRGRNYLRFDRGTTGSSASLLSQYLGNDDVRHLAGVRVAISFLARASANDTDINVYLRQHFGTGGSPSADVDSAVRTLALDTNFRRYSAVIDVPAITGKTIGSNEDSSTELIFELPTAEGVCFVDFDQVKLEIGRLPTRFVADSLAVTQERCSLWFEKSYANGQNPGSASSLGNVSIADSAASSLFYRRTVHMTTRKRRSPTVTLYAQGTGTANKVRNATQGTDIDPSVTLVGPQSFHAGIANSSDVDGGDAVQFSWVAAVPLFE